MYIYKEQLTLELPVLLTSTLCICYHQAGINKCGYKTVHNGWSQMIANQREWLLVTVILKSIYHYVIVN